MDFTYLKAIIIKKKTKQKFAKLTYWNICLGPGDV